MEKERGSKVIAIVALLIAVVGLSVGFAAYSSTLIISNTSATVGASSESDFNVIFSTSGTSDDTTIANLVKYANENGIVGNAKAVLQATTDTFEPSMTGTTISGLSAEFTGPGESVTYTLYAHNAGKFVAYLNSLTIGATTCTANEGTTQSLVDAVCPSITMSVKVEEEKATTTSLNDINNHSLGIGNYETITIVMNYGSTEARVDGDFTVNFGQISLQYDHLEQQN